MKIRVWQANAGQREASKVSIPSIEFHLLIAFDNLVQRQMAESGRCSFINFVRQEYPACVRRSARRFGSKLMIRGCGRWQTDRPPFEDRINSKFELELELEPELGE